ncbi:replicative DNA helicase [Oligoflexia bacterium]|nr:replicative DNA helicase [Oligoflexia bacterium]
MTHDKRSTPPSSSSVSTKAPGGTRIPPHSTEAEESVIGGVLLDNDVIDVALEKIRPEDFYRTSHRAIFSAMASLTDRNEPIDVITLSQELRSLGALDESGGMDNLTRLASVAPSTANVGYYARVVKDMALRRNLIHQSSEVIHEAFDLEGNVEDFLDSAEQKILGVSDYRITPAFHKIGDVVQDSIKTVESLYERKEPVTGISSGFKRLDDLTAGFQPADLIIIAGRPSMGKTALALSVCQYAAVDGGQPVVIFSLEMSKEQLVMRMLCSTAKVDSSRVRTGNLAEQDFPKLVDAASKVADAPIYIDDTPALSITELRAKCRRLHREHPLALVFVDYLQLMRSPLYSQSREQEISDISRSLKALAKELHVPVVALSQLNRSLESRNDKRPIMSDLRESGAIEQDADLIGFIYRDEVYDENTTDKGVAELIISKQRNGPTGIVRMAFIPKYTMFANLDERDLGDEEAGDGFTEGELDLSELDADMF